MNRSVLTIFLLLLGGLLGCASEREAELLSVHEVTPELLLPGSVMIVRGAGFPPGREARVRLEGVVHRPGATPQPLEVELHGRAVSAERVDAHFTETSLTEFGGRGTLRGRVVVLFAAALDRGDVIGSSPELVLDVAEGRDATVDALERQREGEALLESVGLSVADPDPDTRGLEVTEVREGSTAQRVGVLPEDRLVELDGIRVLTVRDLVPSPVVASTDVRVERRGQTAPFVVRFGLEREREGMREETIIAAQVALGWFLFALILLAPSAGLLDWLGRRTHRRRGGRRAKPTWRQRVERSLFTVPVIGMMAAAAACVPALDRVDQLIVPLEGLALAALAVRISTAWLASTGADPITRLVAILHAVGGALLIAIGLLGLSSLGGTTDLAELASQQEANPLRWALFVTPLAPLLGAALFVGAGSAPKDIARGHTAHAKVARAIDDVLLAGITGAAAGVLLGGWGSGVDPVRAAVYVGLTVGLWWWLRQVRRASRINARSAAFGVGLGALAVALSAGRIALRLPPELETALAQVTGGAVIAVIVIVAARVVTGRTARSLSPPHPFL